MVDKEVEEKIEEWLEKLLLKFCARVVEDAKQNVASNGSVGSGLLMAGIKFEKLGKLKYRIICDVPYAGFVEKGTKAHVIRPKTKKALAFAKFGGKRVYRGDKVMTEFKFGGKTTIVGAVIVKKVDHPGTPAQPFLEPAIHLNLQRLETGTL